MATVKVHSLEVDIYSTTQFATVRRVEDGRAVATLQRRRTYEAGPRWRLFRIDGAEVAAGFPTAFQALRQLRRAT